MNNTIQTVLSLSVSGTILAVLVFALQHILKNKISRAFQYYIWLVVLLRLALPLTIEGSIMNRFFISQEITQSDTRLVSDAKGKEITGMQNAKDAKTTNTPGSPSQKPISNQSGLSASNTHVLASPPIAKPFNVLVFLVKYQTIIWLFGAFIYLGWFIAAYLRFSQNLWKTCVQPHPKDLALFGKLRCGTRVQLVCNPYVKTPMLIGFISHRIIIPNMAFVQNGMAQDLRNILAHELTHYQRGDLWYKWFSVLVTSLHWFNPAMIWVRKEINRSCELACDEAVISLLRPEDRPGYGNTLLSIAASKRLPVGIVTTTMCEEKHELKKRIMSIVNFKRKTVGMVAFSIILSCILVGCSVALGSAYQNKVAPVIATAQPSVAATGSPVTTATLHPIGSPEATNTPITGRITVTSEDFNSTEKDNYTGEPYSLLKVTREDGTAISVKFTGSWISYTNTGDLDRDGQQEIMVFLDKVPGSKNGREVHVLRLIGSELKELPLNLIAGSKHGDIKIQLPPSFGPDDAPNLIGAGIISLEGQEFLKIWLLLDTPIHTAQEIITSYNGDGWTVKSAEKVPVFWDGSDPAGTSDTPVSDTLPSVHREGFHEANLTFVFNQPSDERDPDKPAKAGEPTLRQAAEEALRQLYDMTGFQTDKSFVLVSYSKLYFSMEKDKFDFGTFLIYSCETGKKGASLYRMAVMYQYNGGPTLPDAAKVVKPSVISGMSDEEIAKWYYENSSFGDRRKVVKTGFEKGYIRLYLEDGDFYEATLDKAGRVIGTIAGPYEKGFEE